MRKTKDVVISAKNRDEGKAFRITELFADQAEKFAARLLFGMIAAGMELPDDALRMGMAGVAPILLKALGSVHWDLASQLMDEMMACVSVVTTNAPNGRPVAHGEIEEVSTMFQIRKEWIELHTGFSFAAAN